MLYKFQNFIMKEKLPYNMTQVNLTVINHRKTEIFH